MLPRQRRRAGLPGTGGEGWHLNAERYCLRGFAPAAGGNLATATASTATATATETQNEAGADGTPPRPGEAGSESQQVPERNPLYLGAIPKVQFAQAKRFATGVLEHYNKRKNIKFELLDAKPGISIPEQQCCYTHINFTARLSKEDSEEQLFFAEIYHCSKRLAPSGFIVTCCEPLGPDSAVGQKFREPDGTSVVRKNADFTYCFACTERMLYPRGENYFAGHCNIPRIYDYLR